jgi:transcription factor C subunit 6
MKLAAVSADEPRRLGLLAGTFLDGSFSVYAVPYPADLAGHSNTAKGPIFCECLPEVRRIVGLTHLSYSESAADPKNRA